LETLFPLSEKLSAIGRVPDFVRTAAPQYRAIQEDHRGNAVRCVILDCSGTTMDRYVDAPALVFAEVFQSVGVEISMAEARVPMGLRKDLHIKALTEMPVVAERWQRVKGQPPTQADVDALFARFVPRQLSLLESGAFSTLLPGTALVAHELQARGVRIGITTGFTRSMLDILLAGARRQGFVPDSSVAGDEVESPRPKPFMVLKNLERMGVANVRNAMRLTVKVDDTISGVGEGAPMCWSVAVSKWGNYVVDSAAEADRLPADELRARELQAKERLVRESGAHYVIDDLRGLPAVIADIESRLSVGETPWTSSF
jgi:phosphonoacetaldehyde hydrolase